MRTASILSVLFAALMEAPSAHAATLIPVPPVPGSTATYVADINDHNVITGDYVNADGTTHGFFGTLDGNYTTFDFNEGAYPGSEPRAINNQGNIVGIGNVDNATATSDFVQFWLNEVAGGAVAFIHKRRGTLSAGIVGGNISNNLFVTENWNPDNTVDGFTGKSSKMKRQIDLGFSALQVRPRDLTASGDIIGYTKIDNTTGYQGFILHDGATTLINYPDETAADTLLEGMNSRGVITGFWEDANFDQFAFIYDSGSATFRPITIPGYPQSGAGGVNTAGLIAVQGYSQDLSQTQAYIYCSKKPDKCPSGGFEIADPKPVAMLPGFKPHAVPNTAALTPLKAKRLMRQ